MKNDTSKVSFLGKIADQIKKQNIKESLGFAKEALALSNKLEYKKGIADSNLDIGCAYYLLSDFDKSLDYCFKSLKMCEKIEHVKGIIGCYNNIGAIYRQQKQYEKAIDYYQLALEICNKSPDSKQEAMILNNIGIIYRNMKDYNKSLQYYYKALDLNKGNDKRSAIAYNLNNIGVVKLSMGKPEEAVRLYQQALEINQQLNNKKSLAFNLNNLGCAYMGLGEYEKSLDVLTKAKKLATELGIKKTLLLNYQRFSKTYAAMGEFEKAYDYHIRFANAKDSIFNETKSELLAEIQTKYELEKKEDELVVSNMIIEKQRIWLNIFCIALIFLIILIFTLYKFYKDKRSANVRLHNLNQEITAQREEISVQAAALKEANKEIKNINENLEAIISSRTRKIRFQHKQLVNFAFLNAHNIRGPLSNLLGLINAVKNNASPKEFPFYIEKIDAAAKSLDSVTKNVTKILNGEKMLKEELRERGENQIIE